MKITNKIIRNIDFPACKNCAYYRQTAWSNDFTSQFNKCEKFGTKDVITDKITYDFANMCRTDEDLCGKSGKYFEKEPLIILKKLRHKIFRPIQLRSLVPRLLRE